MKISLEKTYCFNTFAKIIDCGYLLPPPRRGGSKEYPQSMCWNKTKKKIDIAVRTQFFLYMYKTGGFGGICYTDMFSSCETKTV